MKNKLTLLLLFVFVFTLLPSLIGELSIGGIRLVQSQDCQARSRRRHRAAPRRTKYSYTNQIIFAAYRIARYSGQRGMAAGWVSKSTLSLANNTTLIKRHYATPQSEIDTMIAFGEKLAADGQRSYNGRFIMRKFNRMSAAEKAALTPVDKETLIGEVIMSARTVEQHKNSYMMAATVKRATSVISRNAGVLKDKYGFTEEVLTDMLRFGEGDASIRNTNYTKSTAYKSYRDFQIKTIVHYSFNLEKYSTPGTRSSGGRLNATRKIDKSSSRLKEFFGFIDVRIEDMKTYGKNIFLNNPLISPVHVSRLVGAYLD